MKYKLVIFDFDGTLANTFSWFAANVNIAAEKYNFKKVDLKEVKELRKYSAAEMLKRHKVPFWKLPIIAAFMRKLMLNEVKQQTLFAGISEMLHQLKKEGILLALVTSNSQKNVSHVLGVDKIAMFDYFVCGVSIFGKKRKLKKVVKKSGIRKEEIIYIGDEIRDGEAAKALGIHFGAVSWGYNDEDVLKLQSPNVIFQKVSDICDYII
jgi:phosphoglycolate phosphatase